MKKSEKTWQEAIQAIIDQRLGDGKTGTVNTVTYEDTDATTEDVYRMLMEVGKWPVVEVTNEAIDEYIEKLLKDAGIETPTQEDRTFIKKHEALHALWASDLDPIVKTLITKVITGETK